MQDTYQNFTEKNSIHIASDTYRRNSEKYKGNPEKDPGGAVHKAGSCFSKPVENTGEGCIHIEEGADKRHGTDIGSGSGAVEKKPSGKGAEKEKAKGADSSQKDTAGAGLRCNAADALPEAQGLHFRYRGHQLYGGRVRKGGGEQNKRQGHTGKNTVNTESLRRTQAGHQKTLGNQYYLDAGKKSQEKPVQGQGKGGPEDFTEYVHGMSDSGK